MKKTLTLFIIAISLMAMSSCFLFKPVQKRCPAYSINLKEDLHKDLITQQEIKTTKEDF